DGLVVSDYYAVSFLEIQHALAASPAGSAVLALTAGLDVELPNTRCFGEPLITAVTDGDVPEELIDLAVSRVLRQKIGLGLLDPGWTPVPGATASALLSRGENPPEPPGAAPDLDPPAQRAVARRLAEESGIRPATPVAGLPLAKGAKIAVVGPLAAEPLAFFGCYSMPRHLGHLNRATDGPGVEVATLLDALREEGADVTYEPG